MVHLRLDARAWNSVRVDEDPKIPLHHLSSFSNLLQVHALVNEDQDDLLRILCPEIVPVIVKALEYFGRLQHQTSRQEDVTNWVYRCFLLLKYACDNLSGCDWLADAIQCRLFEAISGLHPLLASLPANSEFAGEVRSMLDSLISEGLSSYLIHIKIVCVGAKVFLRNVNTPVFARMRTLKSWKNFEDLTVRLVKLVAVDNAPTARSATIMLSKVM